MDNWESIEFGKLLHAGVLRDGGSAVIILSMATYQVKLRVMRSIGETDGPFYNFIEITVDDNIIGREKSLDKIDGLREFLKRNELKIDSRVWAAFT